MTEFLYSRKTHPADTIVSLGKEKIGSSKIAIIAGPCSIESQEQFEHAAQFLQKEGINVMRGSIYKPRSSPYAFQGMREEGLELITNVKKKFGMAVETEVMDPRQVSVVEPFVDGFRIGARNMQNYDLLREVGKSKKPVILKNGLASTIEEFLQAAEYILEAGNPNVVLCLRGTRAYEPKIRFSFDPAWIPLLKKETHLPVIVDPSHPAGDRTLVPAIAKAAMVAGADGLMIEVHEDPSKAKSDAGQQLTFDGFSTLMKELKPIAKAVGREW